MFSIGKNPTTIEHTLENYRQTIQETACTLQGSSSSNLNLEQEQNLATHPSLPLNDIIEKVDRQYDKIKDLATCLEHAKLTAEFEEENPLSNKIILRFFQGSTVVTVLGGTAISICSAFLWEGWPIVLSIIFVACTFLGLSTSTLWYLKNEHDAKMEKLKDFTSGEKKALKNLLKALKTWKEGIDHNEDAKKIEESLKIFSDLDETSLKNFADRDDLVCHLIEKTLPEDHELHQSLASVFRDPSTNSYSAPQLNILQNTNEDTVINILEEVDTCVQPPLLAHLPNLENPLNEFFAKIGFQMKNLYYQNTILSVSMTPRSS